MRTKLALLLSVTLLAASAQAGFLESLFNPNKVLREELQKAQREVPVSASCTTWFSPGNDAIFRRTGYCHRANPSKPRGFLEAGYDVPASFLVGFTVADVREQWRDPQIPVPTFLGTKVEVPVELFTHLNVTAAQVWEKLLACTQGQADLAREAYRTGGLGCPDTDAIRAQIQEVRASLQALATSSKVAAFADDASFEEARRNMFERLKQLNTDGTISTNRQAYHRESIELMRQQMEADDYRLREVMDERMLPLYDKYIPRVPRMHPLLTQVMLEESLSLIRPDEATWLTTRRFNSDPQSRIYMLQLLIWINSVEDRGCTSYGLWPSANRVALDLSMDKAREYSVLFRGPKPLMPLFFQIVRCPADYTQKPIRVEGMDEKGEYDPDKVTIVMPRGMMRLNDVYKEGNSAIIRELLQVRESFLKEPAR